MSSYVKCINAFPTGLLFNSLEGPSLELDQTRSKSGQLIELGNCISSKLGPSSLNFESVP